MSGKNGSGGGGGRRSGNRRRRGGKKQTPKPEEFWGDPEALADEPAPVAVTSQPAAVVKSLGRAPLSGHHNVADHYFTAVYDRSVALASALAAAGDLLGDPSDDEDTGLA
ncbi:MAG: hypothetical protein AAGD35_04570 [Actinomycetota bacterium]